MDRAALKNALEVRILFLDHRIVELVNGAPVDLKVRGGTTTYMLRRLLKDDVPSEILGAPKRGFGIPLKDWLRGELKDFARDLLLSPRKTRVSLIDDFSVVGPARQATEVERHLPWSPTGIWTLLVFEEWCRIEAFDRFLGETCPAYVPPHHGTSPIDVVGARPPVR